MTINKDFLLKLFDLAYMQRWNDKLRPITFIEMDKQAHKFMITYLFAKLEEKVTSIDWITIIEGSIFEYLQRMIVTDIKPTVFDKMRQNTQKMKEFNNWIFSQLEPILRPLGDDFVRRYQEYFALPQTNVCKKIIHAAHVYSSRWEFQILEKANPDGYDNSFIKSWFEQQMEQCYDLRGIQEVALFTSYKKFINLCGQLRFQIRWSNLMREPKTSVLSHSLFVAFTSYLFTLSQNGCEKRCYNNTFTGLFHDLPEVLTRDIISPVKNSVEGLGDLIKECEKEQMQAIVYPLLPENLQNEMRLYTETEFEDYIIDNKKMKLTSTAEINSLYNSSKYNPRDGKLVKAADELSALIEADIAIKNGSIHEEFHAAKNKLKNKYIKMEKIGNIDMAKLFGSF